MCYLESGNKRETPLQKKGSTCLNKKDQSRFRRGQKRPRILTLMCSPRSPRNRGDNLHLA